jgi:hypothetical protein
MTASQLIKKLVKCNPNLTVMFCKEVEDGFLLSEIMSCEVTEAQGEEVVILELEDYSENFN